MGAGGSGGVRECFKISGLLKIVECFAMFTLLMLHRIGNRTQMVFFGASDLILNNEDVTYPTEADAEILGAGVIMAFTIITPMILLAYAVEGRKRVQATYLDAAFCFVGAATLIAAGGMCCFAWNNANTNQAALGRRDFEAAGSLGVVSIVTGIIYLIDFFYVMYQNALFSDTEDVY